MSSCPSCGDDANLQKVSGLYRQQTNGGRSTELAQLLAPPRVDPTLVPLIGTDLEEHFFVAAFGILFAVAGGLVGWLAAGSDGGSVRWVTAWLGVMAGFVPGIVVGYIYGSGRSARIRSTAVQEAEAKRRSPEHLRRLEQWEQAYYCRKHDAVILDDGKVLSPTEFRSLMTGEA